MTNFFRFTLALGLVLSASPSVKCCDSFFDLILESYTRHSMFLVVSVQSPGFEGQAVVENGDLFSYFRYTRGLTKEEYRQSLKDVLISKKRLSLQSGDFKKWRFDKVEKSPPVYQVSSKGKDAFLRTYIDKDLVIKGLNPIELKAVIASLFEWKIATFIDDETGRLAVVACQGQK